MKTMQNYTNYCTEEQTRRAYALGAPIDKDDFGNNATYYNNYPTTQQMIGWLREKGVNAYVSFDGVGIYSPMCFVGNNIYQVDIAPDKQYEFYEQAELAAIDVALDYLEKEKNKK